MESSVPPPSDRLTVEPSLEQTILPSNPSVTTETSAARAPASTPSVPCPRCGGRLSNPEGLGWCPACGYCRSLQENPDQAAVGAPKAAHRPSPLGIVEFIEVVSKLPVWLWVLLGGTTIIVVISVAASCVLPEDSLGRALWSSIQLGVGFLGLFAAQVWAFLLIAPESEHLSAKDLIVSPRLWSMTCRRLPASQRQVWLGGWSVATMLSALFLVGGLSYWYQFYKPKKLAERNLIQAIANAAKGKGKNKSLEESIKDFASSQDLSKNKEEAKKPKPEVDKRPTEQCVILGYTVEDDTELGKRVVTSLALATLVGGKLKYVGLVRRGISPQASDELLRRLTPLVQPEPFVPGLKLQVTWVKPQAYCEVHQSGFDIDGHLRSPRYKDLLDVQ
jgi:hypothetical protein